MSLAKNMKKLRKEKGITQSELSKLIGCHLSHITRIESGKFVPSLNIAIKTAEVLGVDLNSLVYSSGGDIVEEIRIEDQVFSEKIRLLNSLEEEEKTVITKVIDAFLTKKQIQKLVK